jgi:hypothetical protein
MSQRPWTQLTAFALAASAVAIAAILIVVDSTHNGRDRRSPHGPVPTRLTRVVVGRAAMPPSRARRGLRLSSVHAMRTARRFAMSWQSWDTGRRSPQAAATLQRLSVAALWRRLRHQRARPTAARPPASLALESVQAIPSGRGIWRAPLIARQPESSYLGTLVIVTTSAGPRVAAITR